MTNAMRRVLIIAYYWPPSGGGGVQRWLKFIKYLPEYGWYPVVYVPYNPQYPLEDKTLMAAVPEHVEIIKGHIWEARRFYRGFKRLRHGLRWSSAPEMDTLFFREPKDLSWFGRLSLFLRSNLFVPDSRSLWIKPSHRRLRKWLTRNPVNAIISTGPPHSCHLIGLRLKQSLGLPWIADFRDPWLEIDYFPQLMLTKRTRRKHERLQHDVLASADKVITVSWSWAELFRDYGAKDVEVITNGFDPVDIPSMHQMQDRTGQFRITSVGTLEADRNPIALWQALSRLLEFQPELKSRIQIQLAGKLDRLILEDAGEAADLITNFGYLPYQEALTMMQQADILLLLMNKIDSANTKGRIPGKLFEYIAVGKPILMLGNPESDAGKIIAELGNSWCVEYEDADSVLHILESCITGQTAVNTPRQIDISRFERKTLTRDLATALDRLL